MNEPHLASAEFGGFWLRFLAVIADSAIVFLFMVLIIAGGASALGHDMLPVAVVAAGLFALLYWPVMQASWLQATFGKALLACASPPTRATAFFSCAPWAGSWPRSCRARYSCSATFWLGSRRASSRCMTCSLRPM